MWQKFRDLIGASVITLFGLLFFLSTFSVRKYGNMAIDSRSFPQILGILVMGIGAIQIIQSIRVLDKNKVKAKSETEEEKTGTTEIAPSSMKNAVLTIVLMILYALLMKPLGFLLSTCIYTFLQAFILYPNKKKNFPIMVFVSFIFTGLVYFVFVKGFSLVLPHGFLG